MGESYEERSRKERELEQARKKIKNLLGSDTARTVNSCPFASTTYIEVWVRHDWTRCSHCKEVLNEVLRSRDASQYLEELRLLVEAAEEEAAEEEEEAEEAAKKAEEAAKKAEEWKEKVLAGGEKIVRALMNEVVEEINNFFLGEYSPGDALEEAEGLSRQQYLERLTRSVVVAEIKKGLKEAVMTLDIDDLVSIIEEIVEELSWETTEPMETPVTS